MLLDLSLVTQSIINLLKKNISASSEWPSTLPLLVTPKPPDKLTEDNMLGVFLYHVEENPQLKNLPDAGSSQPPVRYLPMALNLYYQITAHSELTDDTGPLREQLIMGLALKTLHDYPKLDDQTEIGGSKIFPASLQAAENRFRISLQPVSHEDAVNYWTAGSQPLRLAAYFQVTVALLEPEAVTSKAARVYGYDVFSFLQGSPRITASSNTVTFTLPGETEPRSATLQPAEVTYGQTLTLTGTSLTSKSTSLLLKSAAWTAALEVDAPWAVSATTNRVSATVQKLASLASAQVVLPGLYYAQVKVIDERMTSDGTLRRFEKISNQNLFTVTPQVTSLGALDTVTGQLDVLGGIFQHAELLPENVQVYIGETRLTAGTLGSLNPGEYAVKDAGTLQVKLASWVSGDILPLRVFINGAESEPRWILVP